MIRTQRVAAGPVSVDPEPVPRRGDELRGLVAPAVPFLVIGAAAVIGGGMLAAVIAHAPTEHPTWASAYLVLVAGVAQMVLGALQAWLVDRPTTRVVVAELIAWNLGNAAVIGGTVSGVTPVVDVGGALLVLAFVLLLSSARRTRRSGWPVVTYRVVITVLLISIPVGLVLAELRAG